MKRISFSFTCLVLILACSCVAQKYDKFTDSRDGKVYRTVQIGSQMWLAENLNHPTTEGSWCYNDSMKYCDKYGRLYTWEMAKSQCPSGWHLPDDAEWQKLIDYLGGKDVAGGKLKATAGWQTPNVGATNSSGFSALPGGFRPFFQAYYNAGGYCYLWSASGINDSEAYIWFVTFNDATIGKQSSSKTGGHNVRCVKD